MVHFRTDSHAVRVGLRIRVAQEPNPLRNRKLRVSSGYQRLSHRRYWVVCERLKCVLEVLGRFLLEKAAGSLRAHTANSGFGWSHQSILVCPSQYSSANLPKGFPTKARVHTRKNPRQPAA